MITVGRMVGITALTLGVGFAAGMWFIGSGVGFQLIGGATAGPTDSRPRVSRPPARGGTGEGQRISVGGSGGLSFWGARRWDLLPSIGCEWGIAPSPLHPTSDTLDSFLIHFNLGPTPSDRIEATPERGLFHQLRVDPATKGLHYTLVEFTTRGSRALDLRPVFFDRAGMRYPLSLLDRSRTPNGNDEVIASEFTLDPDNQAPPDQFRYLGFERVIPDAEWQLVESAQKAAKDKGMAILPIPRPGEPYNLDLTTVEGKRLRSEDFRGKVVLVGIWDSQLGTSAWLLGDFKELRKSHKEDELILVAVSLDESVAKARESLARWKVECELVVIPNDPAIRKLWHEGARISRLPYYFLIGKDGILWYTSPFHSLGEVFVMRDCAQSLFGVDRLRPFMRATIGPPRLEPRARPTVPSRQTFKGPS